jgi:sigma-B regulation protein RsbU (phosphoserine phosphatase)
MKKSLTIKYVFLILLFILPVTAGLAFLSYQTSVSVILEQTRINSENLIKNTINKIELITKPIEKLPQNLASTYSQNEDNLKKQLIGGVKLNSNIFGMAAAFEPYQYDKAKRIFSLYAYKKADKVIVTDLNSKDYDYFNQEWYLAPKKLKKPIWSEPYFDKGGGNILMSTYSYPIIKGDKFIGVTTADISLSKINKIVESIKILKTGYVFLISQGGRFISHPNKELILQKNIIEYAKSTGNKDLIKIAESIKKGKSGFLPFKNEKGQFKIYFAPIKSIGWYIGIVFPQAELLSPLNRFAKQSLSLTIFGLVLLIFAVILVTKKITLRIMALSKNVEAISKGDLSKPIKVDNSPDEIGRLSQAFENMRVSLIDHIENLKNMTISKQKIESELNIARDIQMSILPKIFPPFPTHTEFDIYSMIRPAREVGGDLYDFFFIDEEHFCFLIGDVSGKGVPASLFMAVTKTLLKATAVSGKSPAEILYSVNNELELNNDSCVFVTVFIAVLNIKTGQVEYACAGHNPPVLINEDGGKFIEFDNFSALGVFPDIEYRNYRLNLKIDNSLLLYTDGVNEAFDINSNLYSYDRLIKLTQNFKDKNSHEIVSLLIKDVEIFTEGAIQSDDITILNLKYKG